MKQLLDEWKKKVSEHQSVHYRTGNSLARVGFGLGIAVITISTVVGTSVFASLKQSPSTFIQILLGLVSLSAVVLASLQTFLRFSERAEKHRLAGVNYGKLRREMKQRLIQFPDKEEDQNQLMDRFREKMDQLAEESPRPSLKALRKTRQGQ